MKKIITNITLFFFVVTASLAVAPVASVHAADACGEPSPIFPKWYDGLCKDGKIDPPKGGDSAESTANSLGGWILVIVMNLVKMLLTVVGYVSLAGIIWGGFKFMTQGDNASGVAGARKTIQNAVIGLVLSILSVAIITFVIGAIA